MRRAELERIGVQLPVLPAIALGPLPGEPDWASRLAALGLDAVHSGAEVDSPATVAQARAAAPWSVVMARPRPGEQEALLAAGARLLETDEPVPAGAYGLTLEAGALVCVDSRDRAVEDPNDIAARVIEAAWRRSPAELWVAAPHGLETLPRAVVEDKLAALVEGTRQARLAIAKVQFEDDEFFAR
jgi:hypothetical protein